MEAPIERELSQLSDTPLDRYLVGEYRPNEALSLHHEAMLALENDPHTLEADKIIRDGQSGVDLHRHLEASLTAGDVCIIAEDLSDRLGFNVNFREDTWEKIFARMNGESLSDAPSTPFDAFLGRFSTFALRALYQNTLIQATEFYKEDQNKDDVLKTISDMVIIAYFERVLEKAHAEGLGVLDLMVSPLALTVEGQGYDHIVNEFHGIEEIDEIYGAWEQRLTTATGTSKVSRESVVSTRRYAELFEDVIQRHSNFYRTWNVEKTSSDDKRMRVGLRLCFRREQLPELNLIHNYAFTDGRASDAAKYTLMVMQLMGEGKISGINIGGDESRREETFFLRSYSRFLESFKKVCGSITVHAGETTEANQDAAYNNLEYAIEVLKVDRIGHAMRLFDAVPRMRQLLVDMIIHPDTYPTIIEVNVFSNFMLGLVKNIKDHPIFKQEILNESWGVTREQFQTFIHDRCLFTTDDPNISEPDKNVKRLFLLRVARSIPDFSDMDVFLFLAGVGSSPRPLAKELALIAKCSDLLSFFGGIEGYVKHQYKVWS